VDLDRLLSLTLVLFPSVVFSAQRSASRAQTIPPSTSPNLNSACTKTKSTTSQNRAPSRVGGRRGLVSKRSRTEGYLKPVRSPSPTDSRREPASQGGRAKGRGGQQSRRRVMAERRTQKRRNRERRISRERRTEPATMGMRIGRRCRSMRRLRRRSGCTLRLLLVP
jgi:hypothetical protein